MEKKECKTCNNTGFTHSTHFDADMVTPDEVDCPDCSTFTPMNTNQESWKKKLYDKFTVMRFGDGSPQGGGKGAYQVLKENTSLNDITAFIEKEILPQARKEEQEHVLIDLYALMLKKARVLDYDDRTEYDECAEMVATYAKQYGISLSN